MSQPAIVLVLYMLCSYFSRSLGIDCYHCSSIKGAHKECEDQFKTDISTEHLISRTCMAGYWKAHFCIKLKGVKVDGTSILIRQCAREDWGSHCGLIQANLGERMEDIEGCLETCNFDGCNLATINKSELTILLLIVMTSVLSWKWT